MNVLFDMSDKAFADLRLADSLVSIALMLVLSQILAWHYRRFAHVLSNKPKNARLFVLIAATTMLVIMVVKTSLALSLGLVGALSIIRFRTPIKEAEDLAYLFLSVAIGVGLGANECLITVVLFFVILGFSTVRDWSSRKSMPPKVLLQVNSQVDSSETSSSPKDAESALRTLLQHLEAGATSIDVRRVDAHEEDFNVNLVLYCESADKIPTLISLAQTALPGASVSVVDGNSLD